MGNIALRRVLSLSTLVLPLLSLLLAFIVLPIRAVDEPAEVYSCIVRVVPETVELGPGGVIGQTFTVAVTAEALVVVYGFNMKFGWNTTYLDYVSHTLTVPVEDYPTPIPPSPYPGFLHAPNLLFFDDVDTGAGVYHAAIATLGGGPSLGNGTAFVITLRVKNQSDAAVEIPLDVFEVDFDHLLPGIEHWYLTHDGSVIVPENCSDLAVAKIAPSRTVTGEGYPINFTVALENQGSYSETFNLTFYANTTLIATVEEIHLEKLTSIMILFSWNTTGLARGTYNMSFHLTQAPNESDTADNSLMTLVLITISGDIDGDKDVDLYDIVIMVGAYDSHEGDTRYLGNCDIDGDGDIDIYDIVIAASNYGKSW